MSPRARRWIAWLLPAALLLLGSLQMLGDAVGSRTLKGAGAATAASPAPKVFTSAEGLETFSTAFTLEWVDRRGAPRTLHVTPARYAHVEGPYNRRNAYGAVVAYGPVLATDPEAAPMWRAAAQHGVCGQRPLLRELGVDPASVRDPVRIRYRPREGAAPEDLPLVLEVPCR